jgi:hypothetical protein
LAKVFWLPEDSLTSWVSYDYAIPTLRLWLSANPVQFPPNMPLTKPLEQFFIDALNDSAGVNLIPTLMSLLNVRYILFHNDYADSAKYQFQLDNLNKINKLKLVYRNGLISIFKNTDFSEGPRLINNTVLLSGGLAELRYFSEKNLSLADNAVLFLNSGINSKHLFNFLTKENTKLILLPERNEDLIMATLEEKYFYPLYKYFMPSDIEWVARTIYSSGNLPQILFDLPLAARYELDYNQGFIICQKEKAKFSFMIDLKDGDNRAWIRLLKSKKGGDIELKIDGRRTFYVNTLSLERQGFVWEELKNFVLDKGRHKIEIINKSGTNVLNVINIVPHSILIRHREKLTKILGAANKTLLKEPVIAEKSFDKEMQGSIPLEYRIVKLDNTEYLLKAKIRKTPFWLVLPEIYNTEWKIYPQIGCGDIAKDKTSIFDKFRHKIGFLFRKPLDTKQYIINMYANGWYFEPDKMSLGDNGELSFILFFRPEGLFYLGLLVSGLSILTAIVLILLLRNQ